MAKKKKRSFPTAFTVLSIILVLAAILTYVVPAGKFARLSYSNASNEFVVTDQQNVTTSLPATQEVLDKYNIQLKLSKFVDGSIRKPIAIPGSYIPIEQHPQGITDVLKAPIEGTMDTVNILIFVLILGGCIGLINKVGAFDAGIAALSKKTKGKEFLIVFLVFALVTLGGTTFGLAEETIAFYPILMPVFLLSGFDAITCIAAIYLGSAIGTMFSTINPFSVVIASNAAGINFVDGLKFRMIVLLGGFLIVLAYIYRYTQKVKKDPTASLVYDEREEIRARFVDEESVGEVVEFTIRRKLIFLVFSAAFVALVWGVAIGGWWFEEMSAVFLAAAIAIMFLSGMSEKECVKTFVGGAADLIGVILTVGLARAINIVMDNGMISDTLLHFSIQMISGMSGWLFSVSQLVLFSFLGFFIPSSSGLAVLTMPIIAPLADSVGISRAVVVNAYNWGQGLMAYITPTGLVLITLEMAGTTFNKWLKFILPLMGIMLSYAVVALIISTFVL